MAGGGEGGNGAVEVGGVNEEVVGVVGGDGEDADAGSGQRRGQGRDDANVGGEVEGAFDPQAAPVAVGDHSGGISGIGGDGGLWADEGELVGSAGNGEETTGGGFGPRPVGDGGIGFEAADSVDTGEQGKREVPGALCHVWVPLPVHRGVAVPALYQRIRRSGMSVAN